MEQRVLFLCTGNYFRSRFAELLFNHLAATQGLAWTAESRGLALDLSTDNIGPISPYTLRGLEQRGMPLPHPARFPLSLQERDLLNASLIVALKEAEHRPLLVSRFPQWVDRVEYWQVHDVDCSRPEDALAEIERAIPVLLARLD